MKRLSILAAFLITISTVTEDKRTLADFESGVRREEKERVVFVCVVYPDGTSECFRKEGK